MDADIAEAASQWPSAYGKYLPADSPVQYLDVDGQLTECKARYPPTERRAVGADDRRYGAGATVRPARPPR